MPRTGLKTWNLQLFDRVEKHLFLTPCTHSISEPWLCRDLCFCMRLDNTIISDFWEAHSIWTWGSRAMIEKPTKTLALFRPHRRAELPRAHNSIIFRAGRYRLFQLYKPYSKYLIFNWSWYILTDILKVRSKKVPKSVQNRSQSNRSRAPGEKPLTESNSS